MAAAPNVMEGRRTPMDPLPSLRFRRRPRGRPAMAVDPPSSPEARARAWPMSRSEVASLVEAYADRLVRYACRQVGNVPDAEDVVQDVFVKLIAGGWHDQVALVGPYLFRAVANAC